MKKFAKLSLVAAVAVVGLSSANAGSLEEAIKNVDISGSAAYRYNDYEPADSTKQYYKVAVSLKSKINDDMTFNTRVIAGDETSPQELSTQSSNDANVSLMLTEANFTYTGFANTSITAGKQGLSTPFTVARDPMGAESTGTGVLATTTVGPVTAAAAYFNQTNISAGKAGSDLMVAGLMGSFAGINADLWYGDVQDTADVVTVGFDTSYDVSDVTLSPFARYSKQDNDANDDKVSTWKVGVNANMGIFGAGLVYGESGKDGGVALDGNSSSTVLDEHWRVGILGGADSEVLFANVSAQVTDTVNVALKHTNLDTPSGTNDEQENYVQVVYKPSANFFTYVRFGELKVDGSDDATIGRLHVQYSF